MRRVFLITVTLAALITSGTCIALLLPMSSQTRCIDAENFFFPAARGLWEGKGLVQFDGEFLTHHPPGYATFLALPLALGGHFGQPEVVVARIVNIFWATIAGVGVWFITRSRIGELKALLAAAISVCLPQFLWLCRNGYNEPMFTALLIWAIYFSVRSSDSPARPVIAALLFAAATLTRSIGLLVPFILALGITGCNGFKRQQLLRWSLLLLAYGILLLPWMTFVSIKNGKFTPISSSLIPSHIDGLVHTDNPEFSARAQAHFAAKGRNADAVLAFHHAEISRGFPSYCMMWLRKIGECSFATESRTGQFAAGMTTIPLFLIAALSLFRIGLTRILRDNLAVCIILLIGYFWTLNTIVWSTVRYFVPILWGLAILAFLGMGQIRNESRPLA